VQPRGSPSLAAAPASSRIPRPVTRNRYWAPVNRRNLYTQEVLVQPEQDFDQLRRMIFDSAKRLLESRHDEQAAVTTADVAADTHVDMPLVIEAVKSLSADHLQVHPRSEWQYAEIVGIEAELS
jgi:hypothetical protein